MRIFPKNRALSLFYVYGPLTSCKKIEKTNEPILRTLRHGLTDRRHWIHRTFTPETWVQKYLGPEGQKYGRKDGITDRYHFIGSFPSFLGGTKYIPKKYILWHPLLLYIADDRPISMTDRCWKTDRHQPTKQHRLISTDQHWGPTDATFNVKQQTSTDFH